MGKRKFVITKTDDIPQRSTRRQYEDFFQELLCQMLPNVPRRDIRPSYQNVINFAAQVNTTSDYETVTQGITDNDTLIYFKVTFDTENIVPYILEDGTTEQQRVVNLKVEIYGEKSQSIAVILNALIRADFALSYLNRAGMWLYQTNGIQEQHEFINGQWHERHDVEFSFNECVEIDVPKLPDTAQQVETTIVYNESERVLITDTKEING